MPAFDVKYGKLGHHILGAKPTWEVATFVYSTDRGGDSNGGTTDSWAGLVSVDADGFVVWYAQNAVKLSSVMLQIGPFDQIPGSYDMAYGIWFSSGAGGFPYPDRDDDRYGQTMTGVLVTADVFGNTKQKTEMMCSGITNLNAVTMHELRALSPDQVLLTGFAMHAIQNFTINGGTLENNLVASGTLNLWNPHRGEVSQATDTWAALNPKVTGLNTCPYCDNVLAVCGDNSVAVLDYMHISSAARGTKGNWILSLRNLNMVASLNRSDGGSVEWILSSNPQLRAPSYKVYEFAAVEHAFYLPHHVTQLADDRIILVDDGAMRPNGQNYTRAVEYELDEKTNTATLVWQFEWPLNMSTHTLSKHMQVEVENQDALSSIGNSVTRMPNGHYLVGFTDLLADTSADDQWSENPRTDMIMFDVGKSGKMHSAIKFQGVSIWGEGTYRSIPYPSIYGESNTCPL